MQTWGRERQRWTDVMQEMWTEWKTANSTESKLTSLWAAPVPAAPPHPSTHQPLPDTLCLPADVSKSPVSHFVFSPGKEITQLFGIDILPHTREDLFQTSSSSGKLPSSAIYHRLSLTGQQTTDWFLFSWNLIKGFQWKRLELNFIMRLQIMFFSVSWYRCCGRSSSQQVTFSR